MKTLKLVMLAALVAFTAVSMASSSGDSFKGGSKKIYNISFQNAVKNPGLMIAMYQQVSPDILLDDKPVYVVFVLYHQTIYRITGSLAQWTKFFNPRGKIIPESKPSIGF